MTTINKEFSLFLNEREIDMKKRMKENIPSETIIGITKRLGIMNAVEELAMNEKKEKEKAGDLFISKYLELYKKEPNISEIKNHLEIK